MPVPTYDCLIEPLLRLLSEYPEGLQNSDAEGALAERLALTAEERAQRLPSGGQTLLLNRVGWAHDRLKRAGLSSNLRRGVWRITPEGLAYLRARPALFSAADVRAIAIVERRRHPQAAEATESSPSGIPVSETLSDVGDETTQSPDERIEGAILELRESVALQLLEAIRAKPPEFFEHLVLDVLHAMGYGTSRADLRRVGRSGDGGIDGTIALDPLGLEMIYVQAKRHAESNRVGPDVVQAFYGALARVRATKGVLITTSYFTSGAIECAALLPGRIVLIDGERLAQLMIDHSVGVSHRRLQLPQVNVDYFEGGV